MTSILQFFSKSPKISPFILAPTLHVVNQDIVSMGQFIKTKFFPPNRFQGWIDYYLLKTKYVYSRDFISSCVELVFSYTC